MVYQHSAEKLIYHCKEKCRVDPFRPKGSGNVYRINYVDHIPARPADPSQRGQRTRPSAASVPVPAQPAYPSQRDQRTRPSGTAKCCPCHDPDPTHSGQPPAVSAGTQLQRSPIAARSRNSQ